MDRNRLYKSVKSYSRFEETAGIKINDRQNQIYKGYEEGTSINDKISTGRYGHHESGAHSVSGNNRSTIDDRDAPDATRYGSKTVSSEPATTGHDTGTTQDMGMSGYSEMYGKYSEYAKNSRHQEEIDLSEIKPDVNVRVTGSKALKNKARGSAETKKNTVSKAKGASKDSYKKRAASRKGKFKTKAGGGAKKASLDKIKTETIAQTVDKSNEDNNAAVQAAVAAYKVTGRLPVGASFSKDPRLKALRNRVNNANVQKFLKKAGIGKNAGETGAGTVSTGDKPVAGKTGRASGKEVHPSSGKYSKRAVSNISDLRKKEAAKMARQVKAAQQKKALKNFRQAKDAEKRTVHTVRGIKQMAVRFANKLKYFAARNVTVIVAAATMIVIFIVVSAGFASCAMAFSSATGTYLGGASDASDFDMTDTDSYFTQKEMELQEKIDNIQTDHPGYDEYVFDIDDIGHEPARLMAYLSSRFGSYELSTVQSELDSLFDELYALTLTPRTETRTRMVTRTAEDGTTYTVSEEYEWKILTVALRKKDFDTVAKGRLRDDDEKEMYDIYIGTGGAHQAFYNPFTVDWKAHVSSEFGWRVHPILGKDKFHNGIDIALPAGTEVHACSTGKVIQSYMSSTAGNYVVVQDATGYTCHYMHLQSRAVSVGDVVKHGDLIGKVGSTGRSTGPHLHLGIKDAKGEWMNPRFLLSDFVPK